MGQKTQSMSHAKALSTFVAGSAIGAALAAWWFWRKLPRDVLTLAPPRPAGSRRVTVFCGSKIPSGRRGEAAVEVTRRLGRAMAAANIELVYGGGNIGLMGELARAVDDAGGKTIGIIPKALAAREVSDVMRQPENEIVVATMHERKQLMAHLCDGFIALPGGFGTLEELVEAVTWTQLKLHDKAVGLLNLDGFYDPLLQQVDVCVQEGLVSPLNRQIIRSSEDPEALLRDILSFSPEEGMQVPLDWGLAGNSRLSMT